MATRHAPSRPRPPGGQKRAGVELGDSQVETHQGHGALRLSELSPETTSQVAAPWAGLRTRGGCFWGAGHGVPPGGSRGGAGRGLNHPGLSWAAGKSFPSPVTGEGAAWLAWGLPVHLVPTSQVNLPSPK